MVSFKLLSGDLDTVVNQNIISEELGVNHGEFSIALEYELFQHIESFIGRKNDLNTINELSLIIHNLLLSKETLKNFKLLKG